MSPETVFSLAGTLAALGWAVLILGPRRFPWLNAVPMWGLPALLSAGYALIVLSRFSGSGGGFGSLAEVARLFASDWALLAGWVHFLAFDLFVGAVLAARMDRAGIGRLVQGGVLALIFLLGPFGFLVAVLTLVALRAPVLRQETAHAAG